VLKLRLDNGLAAVFKPRSRLPLGDRRYKGEIAAYRLARALGLGNVPPAMPRSFGAAQLRRAMGTPEAAEEFDAKVRADSDGNVRGALMPWIEHYQELPLEQGPWRAKWEKWLTETDTEIAPDDRAMAGAISTMIVFDYITANWDRWSGNNVARDGATGTVLFVDNDGAFYETPPQQSLARQLALLRRVQRFSRGFVSALRALDASTLSDAVGQDLRGEPLLPAKVLDAADARRKTVLEAIDAQIQRAGDSPTLSLP
jgi:Golgi casein kinase, C-terminal, Fam20